MVVWKRACLRLTRNLACNKVGKIMMIKKIVKWWIGHGKDWVSEAVVLSAATSDKTCWDRFQKYQFFRVILAKMETVTKWIPVSLLPLPNVVYDNTGIMQFGFYSKTTLNRGREGSVLCLFRGDVTISPKLEKRWNCPNSFVWGWSSS